MSHVVVDVYNLIANQMQSSLVLGVTRLAATSCAIGSIGSLCYYLSKRRRRPAAVVNSSVSIVEELSTTVLFPLKGIVQTEELTSTTVAICIAVQSFLWNESKFLTMNQVVLTGLSVLSVSAFSFLWEKQSKIATKNHLQYKEALTTSFPAIHQNLIDKRVEESAAKLIEQLEAPVYVDTIQLHPPRPLPKVNTLKTVKRIPSTADAVVVRVNNETQTTQAENIIPVQIGCHRAHINRIVSDENAKIIDSPVATAARETVNKTKNNKGMNWLSKHWRKFKGACKKTCSKVKQGLKTTKKKTEKEQKNKIV